MCFGGSQVVSEIKGGVGAGGAGVSWPSTCTTTLSTMNPPDGLEMTRLVRLVKLELRVAVWKSLSGPVPSMIPSVVNDWVTGEA